MAKTKPEPKIEEAEVISEATAAPKKAAKGQVKAKQGKLTAADANLQKLNQLKQELVSKRLDVYAGKEKDTASIRVLRKQIARVNMYMHMQPESKPTAKTAKK